MKLCVFGSRTFNNYDYLKLILDNLPNELGLEIISGCANGADELAVKIISGCANGADELSIKYAIENNIPLEKYPANWNKYGKSAGMIRNKQMADIADKFICFWDGQSVGTKNMIGLVRKANKPLKIFKFKEKCNWKCFPNGYRYVKDDLGLLWRIVSNQYGHIKVKCLNDHTNQGGYYCDSPMDGLKYLIEYGYINYEW